MKILSFDIGIKNLAYCVLDKNHTIFHWNVIDLMQDFDKKAKITTDKLADIIFEKLTPLKEILDVDFIVLENQPSMKNPKMKTVQIILLSFFVAKRRELGLKYSIDCFLPRNKLDVYKGEKRQEIIDSITCKSVYSRTKKMSIEFCKDMIINQPDKLEFIKNSKKKDDLADSFIQGASFLYKKKI